MALILTGTSGSTTLDSSAGLTFSDSSNQAAAASPYGLKNRIINGDMVIDQRNAGASITPTNGQFSVDRWACYLSQTAKFSAQQNAASVTPPAGFTNYLGVTSLSAYSITSTDLFILNQNIEGLNVSDLGWGTANAQTVTLSFWVRSSLTGTFGGSLRNSALNRSYPFSFTITAANTWEKETITIAGDTSGTWLTTNGVGINLSLGLGVGSTYSGTAGSWSGSNFLSATGAVSVVGTNGATFYITGVQLERNTTATPFEWIPYGTELLLCQRYFETLTSVGVVSAYTNYCVGGANSTTTGRFVLTYKVQKRSSASISFTTASGFSTQNGSDGIVACTAITADHANDTTCQVTTTVASGLTAGASSRLISNNNNTSTISISAEL